MNSVNPWCIEKVTSNWRHLLFPLQTTNHRAIVIFEGSNCLGLFGGQTALNKKDCISGAYRFHMVPLGLRTISFQEPVLAAENGVAFTVHINLSYKIIDAITIAENNPSNLDVDVKERVRGLIHHYDGKYSQDKWQDLQLVMRQDLSRSRPGLGIEIDQCAVWFSKDPRLTGKNQNSEATAE